MKLNNYQRICPKCNNIITYCNSYVRKRAENLGKPCKICRKIPGIRKEKINKEIEKKIISLHSKGMSNGQIAKKLKITNKPVKRVLLENSLTFNKRKSRPPKYSPFDKTRLCAKCNKIKDINMFRIYGYYNNLPYRGNICKSCVIRRAAKHDCSSIERYLKRICRNCKYRSIKNNIDFNITFEDLIQSFVVQKGLCFYTDTELKMGIGKNGKERNVLSIDRIIPEKGYTKGNVVLCTSRINTVKSDLTIEEIKLWMPKWYKRLSKYLQL